MVIFRTIHGRQMRFALTDHELREAFEEAQKRNDTQDIRDELQSYYRDDERFPASLIQKCSQDKGFIDNIQKYFRDHLDYESFWDQLRACIDSELEEELAKTKQQTEG